MSKTTEPDWAKYKRDQRKRMKKEGYPLRQIFAHAEDWPRIKAFADRLRERRQKKDT